MQKTRKSCLQRDASACISCYPCGISMNYIELKVISCRIEWSLLQIQPEACASYDFYNEFYHKIIINLALRPHRVIRLFG